MKKEISVFDKIQRWDLLLRALRQFLHQNGFAETTTPSLVVCPGTEPTLDIFTTTLNSHYRPVRQFHLPTSPEIHLKKLLAQGSGSIFEIKTCFRNGEITAHHQPEFTMLEYYQVGASWQQLMKVTENLILFLVKTFDQKPPHKIVSVSVAELFQKYTGAMINPNWQIEDYRQLAQSLSLRIPPVATIDDLFFLIWIDKIEPFLNQDELIFVHSYPPFQAALAQIGRDGFAERFEVYWKGLELGNAFQELQDSELQTARALDDMDKRRAMGGPVTELDSEFLSLVSNLPSCSGIAIGVERVLMAVFGFTEISDVRVFSHKV